MSALTPQQIRELADQHSREADEYVLDRAEKEDQPEYGDVYEYEDKIAWHQATAAALRTAADQLDAVQEALARHPKCDKYDEDEVVSCGWKSAVRDITWAVNGGADAP